MKPVGQTRPVLALAGTLIACGGGPAPEFSDEGGSSTGEESDEGSDTSAPPDLAPDCEEPVTRERGFLAVSDARDDVQSERCGRDLWFIAVPEATTFTLRVETEASLSIRIVYPDTLDWSDPLTAVDTSGPVEIPFVSPRSGEFGVLVGTQDPIESATYDLELICSGACGQQTTRFPVVMVHGWTGFENIGPIDYFYGVPDDLRARGYPVEIAVLDPYNSVEVRAAQLAEVVEQVLSEHRSRKIDLVAHSQGGLDSRYLISTLDFGDRVSALTTVATPHRGTPLADIALGLEPGPTDEVLFFLLELLGATGGNESDAEASFWSLSEAFVQGEFNPENPDDARVEYVSWMGETCLSLLACDDVVDAPIALGYQVLADAAGANDGVVPVSSAPWGDYRGTVAADHFDEVGQVAGITGPNFDHREFYRQRAGDLRLAGH